MSRHIAPFGIRFREGAHVEVFPAVEVLVFGARGCGLRATFHVDSGASISIVPRPDADALGISVASGKRISVQGISGNPIIGYRVSAKFQIGSFGRFTAPILVMDIATIPRILGREGVFDRYGILFDEARRRTGWFDAGERKTTNVLLGS